jgi:hypothetical protein
MDQFFPTLGRTDFAIISVKRVAKFLGFFQRVQRNCDVAQVLTPLRLQWMANFGVAVNQRLQSICRKC